MAKDNIFYQGKALRLKVKGKTMFHSTSCGLNISVTLEEIATKDTNGSVVVPGPYTWTLSAETLVVNPAVGGTQVATAELLRMLLAGEEIEVDFTTDELGDILLSGNAYIESAGLKADTGGSSSVSYSFKGNGDLKLSEFKKE